MQDLIQQPFKVPESEKQKEYEFIGHHFIASYGGCQREALNNEKTLIAAMKRLVSQVMSHFLYYF